MEKRRLEYLQARSSTLRRKVIKTRDGGSLKLIGVLDSGMTAVVMKAQFIVNDSLKGYFAVKCVSKDYLNSQGDKSLAERRWYCIERERQLMSRIDNQFIIKQYEPYKSANWIYLVQEFANGGNLKDLIERQPGGCLSERVAKKIIS